MPCFWSFVLRWQRNILNTDTRSSGMGDYLSRKIGNDLYFRITNAYTRFSRIANPTERAGLSGKNCLAWHSSDKTPQCDVSTLLHQFKRQGL